MSDLAKQRLIQAIALFALPGLLCGFAAGCTQFVVDGPGMVNADGILMDALSGDWSSADAQYRAELRDYTISLYYQGTVVLRDAKLLHADSADPDACHALSIEPNALTDASGTIFAVIGEAYAGPGQITLRLTMADETDEQVVLEPSLFMLDGPGSVFEGDPLDAALAGDWVSKDGRYALSFTWFDCALFIDGEQCSAPEAGGYYHYGAGDDENARIDLLGYAKEIVRDGEHFASIADFWYEDGRVYMTLTDADGGNARLIAFDRTEGEGEELQA